MVFILQKKVCSFVSKCVLWKEDFFTSINFFFLNSSHVYWSSTSLKNSLARSGSFDSDFDGKICFARVDIIWVGSGVSLPIFKVIQLPDLSASLTGHCHLSVARPALTADTDR